MKLREHIALFIRGLKQYYTYSPRYFVSHSIVELLSAVTPYVPIYFSAKLIDAIASGEGVVVLALYTALTVGLVFVLNTVSRYLSAVGSITHSELYRQERWEYSRKAMSMAYESIEDRDVFLLNQRIEKESQFGYNMYYIGHCFSQVIYSVTKIVSSLSLSLALFTMASIPLWMRGMVVALIILNIICGVMIASRSEKLKQAFHDSTSVNYNIISEKYSDLISNYSIGKDVRLYGMSDDIAQRMAKGESDFANGWLDVEWKRALVTIPGQILDSLLRLVMYAVLIYAAIRGNVSVGSIARYVSCITLLLGAVSTLVQSIQASAYNNVYLKRYFSYFDIPNDMYKGTLTVEKRDDNEYYLEFRDVSFKYPSTDIYALRHVNLKFRIGEKLAVVGMNGSGKTTFIKLLCRLYDPTEGQILLNGVDIKKYDYDEYMSIFSVVFQDFKLLSFSLGQNVAASAEYDKDRVEACLIEAGFGDRLSEMPRGAETCLYKDYDGEGVEISGGEAQKIALARALYKDAPFIILDEPTAALDPIAEYEIYSRFNEIVGNRTAIYISHRLASCRFCDNIVVFDKGSIVQCGTHSQLLADTSGKYSELWQAQAKYYTESV